MADNGLRLAGLCTTVQMLTYPTPLDLAHATSFFLSALALLRSRMGGASMSRAMLTLWNATVESSRDMDPFFLGVDDDC